MLSSLDFNDDTQVAQAAQQALGELLFVSFGEVPTAQAVVLDPIAEHELRRGQHRGGDGDDGFLRAAAVFDVRTATATQTSAQSWLHWCRSRSAEMAAP